MSDASSTTSPSTVVLASQPATSQHVAPKSPEATPKASPSATPAATPTPTQALPLEEPAIDSVAATETSATTNTEMALIPSPHLANAIPEITVTAQSSEDDIRKSDIPHIAITTAPASPELPHSLTTEPRPTVFLSDFSPASSPNMNSSQVDLEDSLIPEPRKSRGRSTNRPPAIGMEKEVSYDRREAERRENLSEVIPSLAERRAISADRRLTLSRASSRAAARMQPPSASEPLLHVTAGSPDMRSLAVDHGAMGTVGMAPLPSPGTIIRAMRKSSSKMNTPQMPGHSITSFVGTEVSAAPSSPFLDYPYSEMAVAQSPIDEASSNFPDGVPEEDDDYSSFTSDMIEEELETTWILNLSMTFRDGTAREKYFVTYIDNGRWRRVTVSLDYRDYEAGSLEEDLHRMHSQREKNRRIYIEVRASIDKINFFDTVTNLRLRTLDNKLHIHVAQDTNEIINFPYTRQLNYLGCKMYKASDVHFESHASGFVYRVVVGGKYMIMKAIPGRDSVDEFLYEVNALNSLADCRDVIDFMGLIYDDEHPDYQDVDYKPVVGALVAFASRGALVDVIYDHQSDTKTLPLSLRFRWARQIVKGLSKIHESGFVQGDFTLANIVIDHHDNAKIIDINRRGCPVGWEPPEATPIIKTKQRLHMYIGIKSDLYQLGMVLWGLATMQDEPERFQRPLVLDSSNSDVPEWYRDIVNMCLSPDPRDRVHADTLLSFFPAYDEPIQPMMATLSPHPYLNNGYDSDDYEREDRRGRSPMEFGQPTVRNPLVWTSPPSLADASDLDCRDAEETALSSIATTQSSRADLVSKMHALDPDFDVAGISVLTDRTGASGIPDDHPLSDPDYIYDDDDERMSHIQLGPVNYDISGLTEDSMLSRHDDSKPMIPGLNIRVNGGDQSMDDNTSHTTSKDGMSTIKSTASTAKGAESISVDQSMELNMDSLRKTLSGKLSGNDIGFIRRDELEEMREQESRALTDLSKTLSKLGVARDAEYDRSLTAQRPSCDQPLTPELGKESRDTESAIEAFRKKLSGTSPAPSTLEPTQNSRDREVSWERRRVDELEFPDGLDIEAYKRMLIGGMALGISRFDETAKSELKVRDVDAQF